MGSVQFDTLILALSGPSSSGKTTLARLLRDIFNVTTTTTTNGISIKLFIVHEDDFYKTDIDIPWREWKSSEHGDRRLQDWDCVESLDLPLLDRVLRHVKTQGSLPEDFASKEDQNSVGDTHVTTEQIERLHGDIQDWITSFVDPAGASARGDAATATTTTNATTTAVTTEVDREKMSISKREIRICILEGFLLFPPPPTSRPNGNQESSIPPSTSTSTSISSPATITTTTSSSFPTSTSDLAQLSSILHPLLDLKLFLPCTKALTIQRRGARAGYVTLEGFWADPPGYVEELVWPNYVRDHGWLFGDDADRADEGVVDEERVKGQGVLVGPGTGDQGIGVVLDWAVEILREEIRKLLSLPRS